MSDEPNNIGKQPKTWNEKIRRVNFYDEQLSVENFFKAIDANDIPMIEAYLQHGQDPNDHLGNFVTPLHIAAIHGYEYLIRILLRHPQINVNAVDHLGRTPLLRACKYSFLVIVTLLLENNADCNIPDRMGYTPLHHAALWAWSDIMDILLRYDANPNVANIFGKTPLHIACVDNPNMSMVHLLCQNGADVNLECTLVMPVLLACCLNCFDYDELNMIDLLIYYDADVNIIYSPSGQTALHIAAINGFVPLAEILCTAGANPNAMDNQFRTPYDVALQMENEEMVNFLRLFFQEQIPEAVEIVPRKRKFQRRNAIAIKKIKRKRHYETF